jgi:hypothetical protein
MQFQMNKDSHEASLLAPQLRMIEDGKGLKLRKGRKIALSKQHISGVELMPTTQKPDSLLKAGYLMVEATVEEDELSVESLEHIQPTTKEHRPKYKPLRNGLDETNGSDPA